MEPRSPETILDLLRKIKRLADDPAAPQGERDAAMGKLETLLSRHHLTLEDLREDQAIWHKYSYHTAQEKKLLIQIVGKVRNDGSSIRYKVKGKSLWFLLTAAQKVDLDDLWAWHKTNYLKELEDFLTAYVLRHNLGTKPDSDKEIVPDAATIMRWQRIWRMAAQLPKRPVIVKALPEGEGK